MFCGLVALAEPSGRPLPPQHPFPHARPERKHLEPIPSPVEPAEKTRRPRPRFANAGSLGCLLPPHSKEGGRKGGPVGWLDGPGMLGAR